jgi:hypothetical protein
MAAADGVGAGESDVKIAAIVSFAQLVAFVTNDHAATPAAGSGRWPLVLQTSHSVRLA